MENYYIEFDIAGVLLLGVLLVCFFIRRLSVIGQAKFFVGFVVFTMATYLLDAITVVTIRHADSIPLWTNYLLNAVFLSMVFLLPAMFSIYILMALEHNGSRDLWVYRLLSIPGVVGTLAMLSLNYSTHCFFYFNEAFEYTYGPLYYLLACNAFFYIVSTLVIALHYHRWLTRTQLFTLLFTAIVAITTTVFQVAMPLYLAGGYGLCLCILVIYQGFQNPEDDEDALTGLINRRAFYYSVEYRLRKNPFPDFVIVYLNVERFTIINELFGEQLGDQLLTMIADKLRVVCKDTGICARMKGDHFAVLLPESSFDPETFLEAFEKNPLQDVLNYEVQMSCGIYPILDKTVPIHLMCDRARLALYGAKKSPLHYAYYDTALRSSMLNERKIIEEMETALAEEQFEAFFQPVYSLETCKPVSAEALVRWNHPEKGLVAPISFIPLFEKTGFVTKLDRYIWKKVCHSIRTWQEAGAALVPISVNVSRIDLQNKELCKEIVEMIDREGIDHSCIKFEITESINIEDSASLLDTVNRFKQSGLIAMMDDFGNAYSSLGSLKDAPFDQLKIDMSLLRSVGEPKGDSLLRGIVGMAKDLGMYTIAEGVETVEQVEYLNEIGCDAAQGYYFAKPMPSTAFEALLSDSQKSMAGESA